MRKIYLPFYHVLNPNCMGGGKLGHVSQKGPCSHHINTALIKQSFLFDTALVMTYTFIQFKQKYNF